MFKTCQFMIKNIGVSPMGVLQAKTLLHKKPIEILITNRTMFRVVSNITISSCKIAILVPFNYIITRSMSNHGYTCFKPRNTIIGKDTRTSHNIYETLVKTFTGQELPQHEKAHVIVRDNETGKDVGLLTSAKNASKGNIKIAPENFKGDKLPNGQNKPQQFRAFESPRYSKDVKNMKKKLTMQLNIKQANTYKKPALLRVDKNSPALYHPDGRPIYDNHGKEIDSDN